MPDKNPAKTSVASRFGNGLPVFLVVMLGVIWTLVASSPRPRLARDEWRIAHMLKSARNKARIGRDSKQLADECGNRAPTTNVTLKERRSCPFCHPMN